MEIVGLRDENQDLTNVVNLLKMEKEDLHNTLKQYQFHVNDSLQTKMLEKDNMIAVLAKEKEDLERGFETRHAQLRTQFADFQQSQKQQVENYYQEVNRLQQIVKEREADARTQSLSKEEL